MCVRMRRDGVVLNPAGNCSFIHLAVSIECDQMFVYLPHRNFYDMFLLWCGLNTHTKHLFNGFVDCFHIFFYRCIRIALGRAINGIIELQRTLFTSGKSLIVLEFAISISET